MKNVIGSFPSFCCQLGNFPNNSPITFFLCYVGYVSEFQTKAKCTLSPNCCHFLPASCDAVREYLAREREGADGEGDGQAGHDPQEMGGRQRFGTPLKDNVE